MEEPVEKKIEKLTKLVMALVLALVSLQKFPIDFKIQWKCPLQNKNGLAHSKMKFQARDGNMHRG